jgi:hypothetical protein
MRLKSRRAALLLVSTAAVLATLTACGPPSNLPHVTMVGDSTLAGMVWYDQAGVTRSQDIVRAAYDLTLDAESCRRLVAPSCRGRFGYVPNTTMDVLRANRGRLGEAVVIMGGYDDISIGDAVPQILAETEAQGVKHVIWLTYPLNVPYVLPSGFPARSLYANHNLVLYLNSINHPTLHLADWNTYGAGHREWFGTDGIHLTAAGTRLAQAPAGSTSVSHRPAAASARTTTATPASASAGDDRAADDGGRRDDERQHDRRGHDDDLTVRGGGTRRRSPARRDHRPPHRRPPAPRGPRRRASPCRARSADGPVQGPTSGWRVGPARATAPGLVCADPGADRRRHPPRPRTTCPRTGLARSAGPARWRRGPSRDWFRPALALRHGRVGQPGPPGP